MEREAEEREIEKREMKTETVTEMREMGWSTEGVNIIARVCLWFGLEFRKI